MSANSILLPSYAFIVLGKPATQGSMKAFVRNGRPFVTHANPKVKAWRARVADEAQKIKLLRRESGLWSGGYRLVVDIQLARPKAHYRSNGELRTSAPARPTKRGCDIDKVMRAVNDAITGILVRDDAQCVRCEISKTYGTDYRTAVTVKVGS